MTEKPKRQYHKSSARKAKEAANRATRAAKKKLEVAEKKLHKEYMKVSQHKATVRKKTKVANKIADSISGKSKNNVITEEEISVVGPVLQEIAKDDENIVFKPNDGPQTEFLSSIEMEVLYGGAAGGGKSYAMLVDPLRYMHNKNHRALLIRRTLGELSELIDKSQYLYKAAFPGANYVGGKSRWDFPSGAKLYFGYCDTDQDVMRYIGQAYSWIGVDELTHFSTPYVWEMLRSRLRTTDPDIVPYMRATTNPGGIGGWWVKKMFVNPAPYNKAFWATDIDTGDTLRFPNSDFVNEELRGKPLFKRRFIPAKLTDNPYLMQSPEYMANLASMSEVQRRRLLEGDWDIAEDIAFPEFRKELHVVPYKEPPKFWRRFRACDYGFVAGTAVIWFAVSPNSEVYVYRELYEKGLDADTLAERIIELEWDEPPNIQGVLDHDSWARRGQRGPTNAEIMINKGVRWTKADKGPNSRLNGKNTMHQFLRPNPLTGKPKLFFMDNCKTTIQTISVIPLKVEKGTQTITEDVDTNYPDDHIYDAVRYGVNSRFIMDSILPQEKAWRNQRRKFSPADKQFGY